MKYYLIKNIKDLKELCEGIREKGYSAENKLILGEDTETTELEPRNGNLRLIQLSDGQPDGITAVIDRKLILEEQGFGDFWGKPDARNSQISESYYIWEDLKKILEDENVIKVAHNNKFEAKWLEYGCGIFMNPVFDTFIIEQLINYDGPHKLGVVLEERLGVAMDKQEQRSDWSGELTQSQYTYAAKDSFYLPKLREKQRELIISSEQSLAAKIELEFTPVLAQIELDGIKFNREHHGEFLQTMIGKLETARVALQEKMLEGQPKKGIQGSLFEGVAEKNLSDVKLTSHQQITKALVALGVPIFNAKTDEGKRMIAQYKRKKQPFATGTNWNKQLEPLVPYYPEALTPLKEFRAWDKMLSSYGQGILDKLVVWRGHERLFPEFKQIGAPTGRMACKEPNVQQITDKLLKLRECFDAPEDYVLIDADYSQVELRILAHLCQDPAFMEAFLLGRDLHSDTASKVFNLPYEVFEDKNFAAEYAAKVFQEGGGDDKFRELFVGEKFSAIDYYRNTFRSPAKNMNFGIVYGISAIGLAVMIKQSEAVAQEMIDKYYDTYPRMRDWLEDAARSAQKTLQARTMSGRMQKFNQPEIGKETGRPIGMGLIGRNGRNMPVQGTGADILKRAAVLVHRALKGYDARIVNLIHDEILVESHKSVAEEVKNLIEENMVRAATEFITKVPIIAEAKIIRTWSGKDNKEEPFQI